MKPPTGKLMTLIKEMNGVPIHVNSEGRFIAKVDEKTISKPTLREVEKEIGKFTCGLQVISFEGFTLNKYEFIGVERDGRYRDKDNRKHPSYNSYWKSTSNLLERLSDLEKRYDEAMKQFEEERGIILREADHVSVDDFKN